MGSLSCVLAGRFHSIPVTIRVSVSHLKLLSERQQERGFTNSTGLKKLLNEILKDLSEIKVKDPGSEARRDNYTQDERFSQHAPTPVESLSA